jgi:4-amino-4-deoxy-L-arabinose transferase-like glycosyltransferase
MVAPYVGASKDYIAAPLFLAFGARVAIVRLTAIILGVVCIFGLSVFLRDQISASTAAIVALALSVNPTFIDQTLFDNGNLAVSMAAVGGSLLLANRYLISGRPLWALAFGTVLGLAVWSRLNFAWVIASLLVGCVFTFRSKVFTRIRATAAAATGFLIGVTPLLLFLYKNLSSLRDFMRRSTTYHNLPEFFAYLKYRLPMFGEIFFSDGEHRAIWCRHPEIGPGFWVSGCIALAAVVWCVFRLDCESAAARWTRCLATGSFLLGIIFLTSREPIAEHHLAILLPFVFPCVVAFLGSVARRGRVAALLTSLCAFSYGAAAIALQTAAISSIHRNGGLGMWSDAVASVYKSVDRDAGRAAVSILDWGLGANIAFLSKEALSPVELFWSSTIEKSSRDLTWQQEITEGGLFLTTAGIDRVFPAATEGFEIALRQSKQPYTVEQFYQKDRVLYALLYRVGPRRQGRAVF